MLRITSALVALLVYAGGHLTTAQTSEINQQVSDYYVEQGQQQHGQEPHYYDHQKDRALEPSGAKVTQEGGADLYGSGAQPPELHYREQYQQQHQDQHEQQQWDHVADTEGGLGQAYNPYDPQQDQQRSQEGLQEWQQQHEHQPQAPQQEGGLQWQQQQLEYNTPLYQEQLQERQQEEGRDWDLSQSQIPSHDVAATDRPVQALEGSALEFATMHVQLEPVYGTGLDATELDAAYGLATAYGIDNLSAAYEAAAVPSPDTYKAAQAADPYKAALAPAPALESYEAAPAAADPYAAAPAVESYEAAATVADPYAAAPAVESYEAAATVADPYAAAPAVESYEAAATVADPYAAAPAVESYEAAATVADPYAAAPAVESYEAAATVADPYAAAPAVESYEAAATVADPYAAAPAVESYEAAPAPGDPYVTAPAAESYEPAPTTADPYTATPAVDTLQSYEAAPAAVDPYAGAPAVETYGAATAASDPYAAAPAVESYEPALPAADPYGAAPAAESFEADSSYGVPVAAVGVSNPQQYAPHEEAIAKGAGKFTPQRDSGEAAASTGVDLAQSWEQAELAAGVDAVDLPAVTPEPVGTMEMTVVKSAHSDAGAAAGSLEDALAALSAQAGTGETATATETGHEVADPSLEPSQGGPYGPADTDAMAAALTAAAAQHSDQAVLAAEEAQERAAAVRAEAVMEAAAESAAAGEDAVTGPAGGRAPLASAGAPGWLVDGQEPPDLLGGMSVQEVEKKVKSALTVLYAEPAGRNMSEGLRRLRELHALVEEALPSTPTARKKYVPPSGEQPVAQAVPKQRPLAQESADNRNAGLHSAAAATFRLAALQASGVLPPDLLPYDPMRAALALHQAARAGSLEALMALADRHAQGIGSPASCPRALQFAKLAASFLTTEVESEQRYTPSLAPVILRERHADSGFVAAEDAENGADVISLEEDMAMRGNADAMRRMAYRRLVGRGLEADPEGAFHDFQAAAAQGDPYAIFNIGYMHLRGLFVPQNYTAAKKYFEQAAEKGLPSAHNGLGVLAWNGQGTPANLTAARESFERGAALNNSDSLYNLATMHYHGAGTPVNQTLAVELLKRAHEVGHWRAPYMLAIAYESGAGVKANCTQALAYLRAFFADRSTWDEQLTAAVKLLDAGDPVGALLTYVTVAEQGSAAAAVNAAWLLRRRAGYRGAGAEKLAAKYFQRAAKQGHTGAMVELAHMILAAAPPPKKTTEALPAAGATTKAVAAAETPITDNNTSSSTASADGSSNATDGSAASAPDAPSPRPSNTETLPNGTSPAPAPAGGWRGSGAGAARAAGPPLVPSGPLPTRSALLGVSTAEDAVAWYRAAAAAGDTEGLFYLGWAHYRGVGAPANATFARLLWLRSLELAGSRSNRALAPLLALAGMRIDEWLAPLVGPHGLARIYSEAMRLVTRATGGLQGGRPAASEVGAGAAGGWAPRQDSGSAGGGSQQGESRGGVDGGSARVTGEGGVWGALQVGVRWAGRALSRAVSSIGMGDGVGVGQAGENAVMVCLLAALVLVVIVRRRRLAGRTG